MTLRIPLLLASTLMLKMAVVLPADLGDNCDSSGNECTTTHATCVEGICACKENYYQKDNDCAEDCTQAGCPDGKICNHEDKKCIDAPDCTEDGCSDGQICQNVGGNMVCVDGCTEGGCASGHSCKEVQGTMTCVPDCVSDECPTGQSCKMVGDIMKCAESAATTAATTASAILLTGMTLLALRFL